MLTLEKPIDCSEYVSPVCLPSDPSNAYANKKAGELALKAKEISKKNVLIAGSLPAQNDTYEVDQRERDIIEKDFFDQASIINPYIDFFYLDR